VIGRGGAGLISDEAIYMKSEASSGYYPLEIIVMAKQVTKMTQRKLMTV
jgi:hypothetical protein